MKRSNKCVVCKQEIKKKSDFFKTCGRPTCVKLFRDIYTVVNAQYNDKMIRFHKILIKMEEVIEFWKGSDLPRLESAKKVLARNVRQK